MKFENQFGRLEFKENLLQYLPNSRILKFGNKITRKGSFTLNTNSVEISYRDIKTVSITKRFMYQWLLYALAIYFLISGFMEQEKTIQNGLHVYSYKVTATVSDNIEGIILSILLGVLGFLYSKKALSRAKAVKVVFDDGKKNKAYVFASQSDNELLDVKQQILDKINSY